MSRPIVVVANVVYDSAGRVLIGRHLDGHKRNLYAFPGGKVENETCEQAWWRELREETGLKKPDFEIQLEFLGISEQAYKEKRFLILHYAAPYYGEKMGVPKNIEPHKHYAWEWLTTEEILRKPMANSTKDFFNRLYPEWKGYE